METRSGSTGFSKVRVADILFQWKSSADLPGCATPQRKKLCLSSRPHTTSAFNFSIRESTVLSGALQALAHVSLSAGPTSTLTVSSRMSAQHWRFRDESESTGSLMSVTLRLLSQDPGQSHQKVQYAQGRHCRRDQGDYIVPTNGSGPLRC